MKRTFVLISPKMIYKTRQKVTNISAENYQDMK